MRQNCGHGEKGSRIICRVIAFFIKREKEIKKKEKKKKGEELISKRKRGNGISLFICLI